MRRTVVIALPLAAAALGWLGWQLLGTSKERAAPLEPLHVAEAPRSPPAAAPLEVSASETTGERIAGAPEEPATVRSAPLVEPRSAPRLYRGLVLDYDLDLPVEGAQLVFEADGAREICRVASDARGQFRTPQLKEDPRWLRIEPPEGFLCAEPRIDLAGRQGDMLVPLRRDPQTLAGAIRGELLREAGPWTAETLPKRGEVLLDLVPTAGAKWSRRANLVELPDGKGGIRLTFEFESLPKGEYLITLSSLSAWRWNPASLRVTPPIDNLTFLRYDLDRSSQLVFKVSDRASGEAIEGFDVRALQLSPSQDNGVFLHTGPLATSAVPDDARFQWSLWAEGYRPAFGDETAFVRHGGQRIAEVALERGWATKVLVLVRDPAAKPAARAEVVLDGRSMGFTGEDGMLALGADKPPARLEVRLAGWKMANDPLQAYNGRNAAQRGQVTIVMLEKEK